MKSSLAGKFVGFLTKNVMCLLGFKQKPKDVVLCRLEIPEDKVRHIRELTDMCYAANPHQSRAAYYDLWRAVADIYPEVKEGSWELVFKNALRVEVIKTGEK